MRSLKPLKKANAKNDGSKGSTSGNEGAALARGVSNLNSNALKNQPIQDRFIDMIRSGNTEGVIALINENMTDLSFFNFYHTKANKPALAVAAEEGRRDVVLELLKHDQVILVDQLDKYGMTAILYAAKNGELQILNDLFQTGNGNLLIPSPMKETALYLATQANQGEVVQYLIDRELPIEEKSIRNETALSIAIKYEYYDIAKRLLEKGGNINVRRTNGDSPLFAAAFDNRPFTVTFILDHGGEVNHRNDDQETALMIACRHGSEEVIQILLNRGASIDAIDNGGRSALIHAVLCQKTIAVSLLMQRGANVDIRDQWGYTALSFCCSLKEFKFEIIHLLLAAKPDINSLDRCLNTPLILACKNQNGLLAQFLVEEGADTSIRNIDGKSASEYYPALQLDQHK